MYWLKGCDKCGGDLYLEKDRFGSYISCIQCGSERLDFEGPREAATIIPFPGRAEEARAA